MNLNNRRTLACAMLLAGTAGLASPALAGGFYLQDQSAKATGRAYSGEVADTGVDSLWWNPASIAGMTGGEAALNATGILPSGDVVNNGTLIKRPGQPAAAVGGDSVAHNPIHKGVVPSGAIAHALGRDLAVGLAVTAPYNFTTEYSGTSWARYTALTTKLRTIDIQPSVALQLTPVISIGAAVNVEHADATLGNALPNLLAALPDGSQTLKGKGWDVGYSAGVQFRGKAVTVGLSYKSAITHKLNGDVVIAGLLGPLAANNGTISTQAEFTTPWQLTFGGRWKVSPVFTLNAQATRFGWAEFDSIKLGSPLNTAIPEDYRNTWAVSVGFDADLSPKWTVRGGVQRDVSPVQPTDRDARVPDSNRWNFALGATHSLSRAFKIDVAANYLTLANAPINRVTAAYAGTAAQTPILVNGELQKAHVVVLSLGGRIAF
ncbi:OmpP1/FadL family transporter [Novosphingobium sp. SG720]|uniref:OmpP1/FadL family transporter n=1 Tax=Novosphingobium TaxID=165696 RepID=UPI001446BBE5|nr:outer membrane protein transport protein [Novosphingobium sp. SG720]NKJ42013.1 long-chain fatty acid transport protein [Novosphingobium sp. SG720]